MRVVHLAFAVCLNTLALWSFAGCGSSGEELFSEGNTAPPAAGGSTSAGGAGGASAEGGSGSGVAGSGVAGSGGSAGGSAAGAPAAGGSPGSSGSGIFGGGGSPAQGGNPGSTGGAPGSAGTPGSGGATSGCNTTTCGVACGAEFAACVSDQVCNGCLNGSIPPQTCFNNQAAQKALQCCVQSGDACAGCCPSVPDPTGGGQGPGGGASCNQQSCGFACQGPLQKCFQTPGCSDCINNPFTDFCSKNQAFQGVAACCVDNEDGACNGCCG